MIEISDPLIMSALKIIERSRPTSTIPHYPPFAAWQPLEDKKKIFAAWKETIKQRPSIGLNIHIPFCRSVCSFCNVEPRQAVKSGGKNILSDYLNALRKEIKMYGTVFGDFEFSSLYVGGGTPNILTPVQIRKLLAIVDENFKFSVNCHRFFEVNPSFLNENRLKALKAGKVTELGIGIQSLDDEVIRKSGRTQDNSSVRRCFKNARKYGIPRLLIDLIAGLPGQSEKSFLKDVKTVASWKPDDIYLGEFSPVNTAFERSGGKTSDDKAVLSLKKGLSLLKAMGYHHRGRESYATLNPRSQNWRGFHPFFGSDSILGLGAGAVSHAWGQLRYSNTPDWKEYAAKLRANVSPVLKGSKLDIGSEMINFMLSSFERGWASKKEFMVEFGESMDEHFKDELKYLLDGGIIEGKGSRYCVRNFDRISYFSGKAFFEPKIIKKIFKTVLQGK